MGADGIKISTRIDLRHLRYFVAVAETGSISAAAQRLHLSQPPLSVQIRELEETLGVSLMVRSRNGIELTEAGKALFEEAKSVLEHVGNAIEHVLQIGRGEMGTVHVGILSSIMWSEFPDMLKEFHARYPSVEWSLRELSPSAQIAALHDHVIDVGVWRGDGQPLPGLKNMVLSRDSVKLVLPSAHPLAKQRKISLKSLGSTPYLSLDYSISQFATSMLDAMRTHGFNPQIAQTAQSPQTLLALAASGLGFTLLAGSFTRIPWPGVVFRPIEEPMPSVDLHLHVRDQAHSPAVERFLEVMREVAKG